MTLERLEEIKHAIATGQFIKLTEEIGFYSDLIEILDLAAVALKRRAADAARAAASRGKPKGRRKVRAVKPIDAVGREAPPAPAMPKDTFVSKIPDPIPEGMGFNWKAPEPDEPPSITQLMERDALKLAHGEELCIKAERERPFVKPEDRVFPENLGQTIKPVIVSNIPKPPPEA